MCRALGLVAVLAGIPEAPGQAATRQVDIAFVHDDSGSLDSVAADIKANITAFASQLSESSLDWQLALVPYGGGGGVNSFSEPGGRIKNGGEFSTTVAGFTSLIDMMQFDGGTEKAFDALQLAATELNWRPSALKVIILVTDENSDSGEITEASVTDTLVNGGFLFIGMTDPAQDSEFDRIASATNGSIYSVTADFGPVFTEISNSVNSNYYAITATVTPVGAGSVVGVGEYALGTNATLLASPDHSVAPYSFLEWREGGVQVSTFQSFGFQVQGDRVLEAVFELPSYVVTVTANDGARGSVGGGATVEWGQNAALTASADPGFLFSGWDVGGAIVSTDPNYSFPVYSAVAAMAVFKVEATVTVNDVTAIYDGSPKQVTATSSPGGLPVSISYSGVAEGELPVNAGTYAVTAIAEDSNNYGVGSGALTIEKAKQEIDFASLVGEGSGNEVGLGATATSGLPVSYTSSDSSVATIAYNPDGTGKAVVHGPGTTFITATQGGGQNYLPAESEVRLLAIGLLVSEDDLYSIAEGSTAPIDLSPGDNDGGDMGGSPTYNPPPGNWPDGNGCYPIYGEDGELAGFLDPNGPAWEFTPVDGYRGVAVFSYRLTTLPAAYEQRFSGATPSDRFGSGMVVDGDFAVVADAREKKLYTYTRNDLGAWTYTGNAYDHGGAEGGFGNAMALDGNTLLVGAPWGGTNSNAYVFERNGDQLAFVQQLDTSSLGLTTFCEFGAAVALSGDRIVIGAPGQEEALVGGGTLEDAGAVYVYHLDHGTGQWEYSYTKTTPTNNPPQGERFGESVAIYGNEILVGAPQNEDRGHLAGKVCIYLDFGSLAFHVRDLLPLDVEGGCWFGTAMAIHRDRLVVGRPAGGWDQLEDRDGAVYLFERDGGHWELLELLEAEVEDGFVGGMGSSVAITDEFVIAGAPTSSRDLYLGGEVYIFREGPDGWERLRIPSGVPGSSREWGTRVAVDDQTLMVGEGDNHPDATVTFVDLSLAFGPESAKAEVRIQIGNPNVGPVITSTAPTSTPGDQRFTYQVAVDDPDDAPYHLDFTLESAPRGMIITAQGEVLWFPAPGVTTSGDVTVVVRDGGENGAVPATETFRVDLTSPGVFRFAFFPFDELLTNDSPWTFATDVAGITEDGLTVAANARETELYGGFLWSRRDGLRILPHIRRPGVVFGAMHVSSISGDGTRVGTFYDLFDAGESSHTQYDPWYASVWEPRRGYRLLDHPHPPSGGVFTGAIVGMNRSGDIAAGTLIEADFGAYGNSAAAWEGVYRELLLEEGDLTSSPPGISYFVKGISPSGTVTGERHTFDAGGVTNTEALWWRKNSSGAWNLQEFNDHATLTGPEEVHGVSGDYAAGSIGDAAVFWASGSPRALPALPATTGRAVATGLSEDALKVVGFHETASGQRAFFALSDDQIFDLEDEMAGDGIVVEDYKLTSPVAVSANGAIIVGNGERHGDDAAWMVEMLDSTLFPPQQTAFVDGDRQVDENAPPGTVLGRLETLGGLVGEAYSYELIGGSVDSDLFALGGAGGDEVLTTQSFDYEVENSYSIHVRAVNSVGAVLQSFLTVRVEDVSELDAIDVVVQPAGEGMVTGDGIHEHGRNATLEASPPGDFIEWLEGGSQVSTDAVYSFEVLGPRSLTARFKLPAQLFVSGTDQVVDGSPHGISVTTVPDALPYEVLYDGSPELPVGPGAFPFVVRIEDAEYKGEVTGVLNLKEPQVIDFPDPGPLEDDGSVAPLFASASSGLPVSVTSSNPAVATVAGLNLQVVGAGVTTLTATQAGNDTYLPADPVEMTVTVIPNSAGFDAILFDQVPVPPHAWQPTGVTRWEGDQTPPDSPGGLGKLDSGSLSSGDQTGLAVQVTGPLTVRWNWRAMDEGVELALLVNGEEVNVHLGTAGNAGTWRSGEVPLAHGVWSLEWRIRNDETAGDGAGQLADFEFVYGEYAVLPPIASAVTATQIPGTYLVEITYDLIDLDSNSAHVFVQGSYSSGDEWNVPMSHLRGDVGPGVGTGTDRTIIWDMARDFAGGLEWPTMRIRVVAYDYPNVQPTAWSPVVENGMALIPPGPFILGEMTYPTNSFSPARQVHLKPYSIGIHEVSNQEVVDVFNWALDNDASGFLRFGGLNSIDELKYSNYSVFGDEWSAQQVYRNATTDRLELRNGWGESTAAYADHPCATVSRFGAMLYCHYRSQMEGLDSPYTPIIDQSIWPCDFTKNGYRLPTEAEWEKAARAGSQTPLPWGSGATHADANYRSFYLINYDDEPAEGLHPLYDTYPLRDETGTAPVSAFQPNAYGLHQVVGNVAEWCWDTYWVGGYHENSIFDPLGSPNYFNSDPDYVKRDVAWDETLRPVYARSYGDPENGLHGTGFRIARSGAHGVADESADFAVDTRLEVVTTSRTKLLDRLPGGTGNAFGSAIDALGDRVVVASLEGAEIRERQPDQRWIGVGVLPVSQSEARRSVALASDHAVVASTGQVAVFERLGDGTWQHLQDLSEPAGTDQGAILSFSEFGGGVVIDGRRMVVRRVVGIAGPDGVSTDSVRTEACLFELQHDGFWTYQTKMSVLNPPSELESGDSMAFESGVLMVGSNQQVSVFEEDGVGDWIEQSPLVPTVADPAGFGTSLSLHGDWLAVSSASGVSIYRRSGGVWSWFQDFASGYDLVGNESVEISERLLLLGGQDSAWLWQLDPGTGWIEVGELPAYDGPAEVGYGAVVGLSATHTFVGAPDDYEHGDQSGSVYVVPVEDFALVPGNAPTDITLDATSVVENSPVGTQVGVLAASDVDVYDSFTYSLDAYGQGAMFSIDGDRLLLASVPDFESGPTATIRVRVTDSVGNYFDKDFILEIENVIEPGEWFVTGEVLPTDLVTSDGFGASVSVDGNLAIVGTPNDNEQGTSSGSVFFFQRIGGVWTEEEKVVPDDGAALDVFGTAVAISGTTAVIGAPENGNYGAVYFYERENGVWTFKQKLRHAHGSFGASVDLDGDTAIAGAPDDQEGKAVVYRRVAGVWAHEQTFSVSDDNYYAYFGRDVAIDGDRAIVGAPGRDQFPILGEDDDEGAVFVYTRSGTSWSAPVEIYTDSPQRHEHFGTAVSMDGDRFIASSQAETAYLFEWTGSNWDQVNSVSGRSVSMAGAIAVCGRPNAFGDPNAAGSRAVEIHSPDSPTWADLTTSVVSGDILDDNQQFGSSVSTDGQTVMVGADLGGYNSGADPKEVYFFAVNDGKPDMAVEQGGYTLAAGVERVGFGSVDIYQSQARTFTVRNNGLSVLAGTSVSLVSGDISQFDLSGGGALPDIAPGGSRAFSVAFNPQTGGDHAAILRIDSIDLDEPILDVELAGVGSVPPAPEISVNESGFAETPSGGDLSGFGDVVVGDTAAAKTVVIRNTGDLDLTVSSISMQSGDTGDFDLGVTGIPAVVPVNEQVTFTVGFQPLESGVRSAVIRIQNDDPDEPHYDVMVEGSGVGVPVRDYLINFGANDAGFGWTNVAAAQLNAGAPVALTDRHGNATGVAVRGFAHVDPSFLTVDASSEALANGGDWNGGVDKEWTTPAAMDDYVRGGSFLVAVSGLDPTQSYRIEMASASNTIGNSMLHKVYRRLESGNNSELDPDTNYNGAVDGFGRLLGTEYHAPWNAATEGWDNANWIIWEAEPPGFAASAGVGPVLGMEDDDLLLGLTLAGEGSQVTPLNALRISVVLENEIVVEEAGVGPLAPGGTASGFGSVEVGEVSAATTIRIRNTGNIDLNISDIAWVAGQSGEFALDIAETPFVVPADGEANFTVSFAPTQLGPSSATLRISNDDPDQQAYDIGFSGTGFGFPEIELASQGDVELVSGGPGLDFGDVAINATKTLVVTIRNTGSADLTGLSVTGLGGGGSGDPFINEIHYKGDGMQDFVEVAGPAGTDLSGWQLKFFSGSTGQQYKQIGFSGAVIPDEGNGYGAVHVVTGIQNGFSGVALFNSNEGIVSEFISWGGTIQAIGGGPVDGMISTDIGVSQQFQDIGQSLQKTGLGESRDDFLWMGPNPTSPGAINADQTFEPAEPPRFSVDASLLQGVLAREESASFKVSFHPLAAGTEVGELVVISNDADESSFLIPLSGQAESAANILTSALAGAGLDPDPEATPFNDGVSNLRKYAFNMDLEGPDSTTMTPGGTSGRPGGVLVEEEGQTYWRVEFVERIGSGLSYVPMKSTTLTPGSFEPLSATPQVEPIDGQWRRVIYDEPCDPSNTPRCFSFVEVALP